MKFPFLTLPVDALLAVTCGLYIALAPAVQASSPTKDALAFWDFESPTLAEGLVEVGIKTPGITPALTPELVPVKEKLLAANAGKQAILLSVGAETSEGSEALRSNSPALRLGGAQTFWIRVKMPTILPRTVALMARSRPVNGLRGISLEMTNGRLGGFLSSDGQTYDVQMFNRGSKALKPNRWYDVSLRFDPRKTLRIDLYDPLTGDQIDSIEKTDGIPAGISSGKEIGSGYFQIGSANHGSSGSVNLLPPGSEIESVGVWDRYLTDAEIQALSSASK